MKRRNSIMWKQDTFSIKRGGVLATTTINAVSIKTYSLEKFHLKRARTASLLFTKNKRTLKLGHKDL